MTIRVARITRDELRRVWREGIFSLLFCAAMYFDLVHGFDRVLALLSPYEIHSKSEHGPRAGSCRDRTSSVVSDSPGGRRG